MTHGRHALVASALAGLLIATGACSGGAGAPSEVPRVTPSATQEADVALTRLVGTLADACANRDAARLGALAGSDDQLRRQVRDARFVFGSGAGVELVDHSVQVVADVATVRVELRVREQTGQGRTVRETWRFRREDGRWRLDALPPCAGGPQATPSPASPRPSSSSETRPPAPTPPASSPSPAETPAQEQQGDLDRKRDMDKTRPNG